MPYSHRKIYRKIDAIDKKVKQWSETRYRDELYSTNVSVSGALYLLNGLEQGDQGFNREGDWATLKKIKLKGNLIAADPTQMMRVMVFIDYESNGNVPLQSELLDTTVISTPTLAFRNTGYFERFSVLYDELFNLVPATDVYQRIVKISLNMNLKTNYSLGNTGTIDDISRGAVYLYVMSDSTVVNHPTMTFGSRIKFVA